MSSGSLESANSAPPVAAGIDPHRLVMVAWAQVERGETELAFATLSQALRLDPGHPQILTALGALYRRAGRLRDALLHCDAAIRTAPAYVDAWLERGFAFHAGNSMDRARGCFRRVLELDPTNSDAHAFLAEIAASEGDWGSVREHAAAALSQAPGHVTAALAFALCEIGSGQADRAVETLKPLVEDLPASDPNRSLVQTALGDAYAAACRHVDAYATYSQANAEFARAHERPLPGKLSGLEMIDAVQAALLASGLRARSRAADIVPSAEKPGHIFLIGHPRSGTTLVENVLASLPGVHALEERQTLRAVDENFLRGDARSIASGVAAFAALSEEALDSLRSAYWNSVRSAGIPPDARHFVDMDPMKGLHLPFIARLFPDARIVVMRRDPRDVVWSCFRTAFAPTTAALEFTTLERTARHYDALMRLTDVAIDRLELKVFDCSYHRLVHEFEPTTRALCSFAGIPWSEAVMRFAETAKTRGVSTASAQQVRKGLYDGGGQWKPHAAMFAPVLPLLDPWIERFGSN